MTKIPKIVLKKHIISDHERKKLEKGIKFTYTLKGKQPNGNNGSFYTKEELALNKLENHQLFYDDQVSVDWVMEFLSRVKNLIAVSDNEIISY